MKKQVQMAVTEKNGKLRAAFAKNKANIEFAEMLGFSATGASDSDFKTRKQYAKELHKFIPELTGVENIEIQDKSDKLIISATVNVNAPIYKLRVFEDGDAAHWTPNDLGVRQLHALKRAIARKNDFTTGWYSCKKESATTKIVRVGDVYKVGVSVFADSDEESMVETTVKVIGKPAEVWTRLEQTIENIWKEALKAL